MVRAGSPLVGGVRFEMAEPFGGLAEQAEPRVRHGQAGGDIGLTEGEHAGRYASIGFAQGADRLVRVAAELGENRRLGQGEGLDPAGGGGRRGPASGARRVGGCRRARTPVIPAAAGRPSPPSSPRALIELAATGRSLSSAR